MVREVTAEVIPPPKETPRLTGPTQTMTITFFPIKSYSVRKVLEALELRDLKAIAKSLEVKIGKNKKECVKNLYLSGKITQLGVIE